MTLARCKADITVRTIDGFGRRMGPGAFVDLDERLDDNVSMRDALGALLDTCFELLDVPALPSPVVDSVEDGDEV